MCSHVLSIDLNDFFKGPQFYVELGMGGGGGGPRNTQSQCCTITTHRGIETLTALAAKR